LIYKNFNKKPKNILKFIFTVFASALLTACATSSLTLNNTAPPDSDISGATQATEQMDNSGFADAEDAIFAIHAEDYTDNEIENIWGRVRAGFSIADTTDNPRLIAELNWYAGHQKYIDRVITRAGPFLHFVLEEAEKRDLPTELVLLPIVESAYQAFAYSHGRAAGIWQFIPSTGKIYGLKQNWWYDGRRDIVAATDAALNYLQKLHKDFNGDWMLALAAYNSGEGNVGRAIR